MRPCFADGTAPPASMRQCFPRSEPGPLPLGLASPQALRPMARFGTADRCASSAGDQRQQDLGLQPLPGAEALHGGGRASPQLPDAIPGSEPEAPGEELPQVSLRPQQPTGPQLQKPAAPRPKRAARPRPKSAGSYAHAISTPWGSSAARQQRPQQQRTPQQRTPQQRPPQQRPPQQRPPQQQAWPPLQHPQTPPSPTTQPAAPQRPSVLTVARPGSGWPGSGEAQQPAGEQQPVQQQSLQQRSPQPPTPQRPAVQQPFVQPPSPHRPAAQQPVIQPRSPQRPVVQQPAMQQPAVHLRSPQRSAPQRPVAQHRSPQALQPGSPQRPAPQQLAAQQWGAQQTGVCACLRDGTCGLLQVVAEKMSPGRLAVAWLLKGLPDATAHHCTTGRLMRARACYESCAPEHVPMVSAQLLES